MKLLAIDTATERCSVALRIDGHVISRSVDTPRGHADLILALTEELLREGATRLQDLDAIAYGRGPGAFTGVRIAIGVVQGLAFGASLPTVGVSNLAAVAQQIAKPGERVLVCMDARMNEVYWGLFFCDERIGLVKPASEERVGPICAVNASGVQLNVCAGTGFGAYAELAASFGEFPMHSHTLPRATDIALLGEAAFLNGEGLPAQQAQPVYLRDNVAIAKKS